MTRGALIGLLRAVNIGSHNKIAMPRLREFLLEAGMADPRTLLQSGNFVCGAGSRRGAPPALEELLEREASRRLGLRTEFFIRTTADWDEVIEENPFPREAASDPSHLLVVFLKEPPEKERVAALQKKIAGREQVRPGRHHLYVVYPDGIGRSRLTAALIEKAVGARGTGRNWNTILKLAAMAAPAPAGRPEGPSKES